MGGDDGDDGVDGGDDDDDAYGGGGDDDADALPSHLCPLPHLLSSQALPSLAHDSIHDDNSHNMPHTTPITNRSIG